MSSVVCSSHGAVHTLDVLERAPKRIEIVCFLPNMAVVRRSPFHVLSSLSHYQFVPMAFRFSSCSHFTLERSWLFARCTRRAVFNCQSLTSEKTTVLVGYPDESNLCSENSARMGCNELRCFLRNVAIIVVLTLSLLFRYRFVLMVLRLLSLEGSSDGRTVLNCECPTSKKTIVLDRCSKPSS